MSLADEIKTITENIEKVYFSGVDNGIKSVPVEQTYNPESQKAQSGVAVAEAIKKNEGQFSNIATGEDLYLKDSSDLKLKNLKIFGKTTQSGTPAFDSPAPFVNVGESGNINVYVKNDGEQQELALSIQAPMFGLPVKKGGNYTDLSGQQWLCNEIDLQRGIYIKRVDCKEITFNQFGNYDNGNIYGVVNLPLKKKEITYAVLCENAVEKTGTSTPNTFYENVSNCVFKGDVGDTKETLKEKFEGGKIIYPVNVIEEIPLSTADIENFKQLHTYKDVTNIYNSENACMQVEYTGDVRNYIKSELEDTTNIASTVSNATVLVSNNKSTYIERSGVNVFIKPESGICIYCSTIGLFSVTWEDICNSLDSKYIVTSDMGVENCLALNHSRAFVFDVINQKFKVISHISDCNPSVEIPLFFNNYGSVGGRLVANNNRDAFERLNAIDKKLDSIPTNEFSNENATKIKEFSALFNNMNSIESFIFFTDPHLTLSAESNWENIFKTYLNTLKEVDKMSPTSFVVCGGDWLDADLQTEACYKLGYIDSYMKSNFDDYHLVLGNHDTNYQGKLDADSENYTGTLTNETIKNLWYRKTQKAYYRFEGQHTDYYVLDTQIESTVSTSDYSVEQLSWFANELIKNNSPHTAIFMHMYINANNRDSDGVCHPTYSDFSMMVGSIISAFNSGSTIEIGGETYNFSECTGHIDYVMCGHTHLDYIETIGGVPCIITKDMRDIHDSGVPTFDLCLVDYDNNKLHLVRIGTGEDRIIDI